nr:reverse transcriptase domain-containing protein [Tanacetum cinerariifolium]
MADFAILPMAYQRTMAQLLQEPIEGYEDATVVPITADNFKLKHGLLTLVQNKQFFGHDKEDPHDHTLFQQDHFYLEIWLEKELPRFIFTWDDLVLKFINQFFPPSKTTNLHNEITNFQQLFDESFSEAWDRFKDLLRACPHHGFSKLHQLDTFYNALNSKDQDSLNSAAGGNFIDRMPRECLAIIESKSKVRYSRNKPVVAKVSMNASTSGISPDVAELKDMVKALLLDKKSQSPAPVKAVEESCVTCGGAHSYRNCPATDGNVYRDNIQEFISQASAVNYNQGNTSYRPPMMSNQIRPHSFPPFVNSNSASTSSSGTLLSHTIANPRSDLKAISTRSGVSYDGPQIPPSTCFLLKVVENEPEATKDTVNPTNNGSTQDVQPQVVKSESLVLTSEPVTSPISEPAIAPVSASKPNPKASIPYPSRRNNERNHEKANNQIEKFYQIFKDMSFKISFTDALILMPKFAYTFLALIGNKEKLSEMAQTPLNEHCFAVLLKKLPKKLGDPRKFLIPCDFLELADRSISHPVEVAEDVYVKVELADRSISHPVGVAEDVYVKVGSFHFPADFVVVDFDADPRVPLILRRSFLKTVRSLIDVFEGELTLRVGKEAITSNLDQTSRYSANDSDMMAKHIDVIDMACEENSQEVLGFSDTISSGNPTPYYDLIVSTTSPTLTPFRNGDFLLEEVDAFLAIEDDPTSPKFYQPYLNPEGDILLLEAFLNDDPSPLPNQGNYMPEVYLPPHLEYAFLEGDDKLPVIIEKDLSVDEKTTLITVLKSHKRAIAWKVSDIKGIDPEFCIHKILMEEDFEPAVQHQRRVNPKIHDVIKQEDQEKNTFTCLYRTFAYRRMPFGLCNAPGTFQRCTMAIFYDMIEKTMEVFMDDFSVFRNSFQSCLSYLERMLKRCEDTNLCLNWEKSHFMLKEGIFLGYKISKQGIEVDKAKVDVITKLPHPTTVKGIRSFLGHAGFYRRFIKDFSKIARSMTRLLEKDTPFIFSQECVVAFQTLKRKLTEAPILTALDWDMPFDLMCDASDYAIGAVLGQRQDKHFRPIHYASKTMTEAESNYSTTEKEMLAVVKPLKSSRLAIIDPQEDLVKNFNVYQRQGKISQRDEMPQISIQEEAKAHPTNDSRVVCKFLKNLFARFDTPKAIIGDRGMHFCNDQFTKVMQKYGVTHRLATPYHPQTSVQVEVSNHGLTRILGRAVDPLYLGYLFLEEVIDRYSSPSFVELLVLDIIKRTKSKQNRTKLSTKQKAWKSQIQQKVNPVKVKVKNGAEVNVKFLLQLQPEEQRLGNVAGARETVGTTVVQKSRIHCYNCKEFRHVAKECQKPKRAKDAAYHREKMILCMQEEARIQLNVDQVDWRDDTNDELEDQELEAHYMYIAQIQEVSPDAANSGPIFDTEPVQKVPNNDHYNVFAIESEYPEQSESVNDTYLIEQDEHNVIIDSLDMCYDREQIDQNDDNDDLANERELLAFLIEKLKCEIDESKNQNKFLETSNKVLVEKLKGETKDFKTQNKSLESSNNRFKEANNKLSETNKLMYTDLKKFQAEIDKRNDVEYASKKLSAHQETISILSQAKEAQIKLYKTREDIELDKVIALENKVKFLKKAQRANPRMYDIGCYNDNLALMLAPESNEEICLEKEIRSKLRVIPTTNVSRPQLKSNPMEDRVMLNNSQGKKHEVEDQRRNVNLTKNKTFVTACNDSLNAKTLNVNFVCATCGKCVLKDKHDMCVLKSLNGVNSRTKIPIVVPVSTREPKRTVKQSIAKPLRKTVASETINQKPRNITRKLYERVSKACSWWYPKFTPSGYTWKPKSKIGNVNQNLVEIVIFIVDSGCSKHMTGNLKLLINFVEKFLGTVKFGNDQIVPILSYGDLVQGAVMIKWVYYVEGLNHNLFSVGQFCDADLKVAFLKSTCYIRDLKGNDILTGSRGTDLYSITLQDTNSSNPICLMAKVTSSQAWLWHRRLSHLNFNTINLLSQNDIVVGLPKLKFIKDHLCSSCELGKAKRKSFQSKITPSSKRRLQLLHMDLCGPMRVASINGKKCVLVFFDDYSRYTWTYFLRSKDETPKVLNDFLRLVQRRLHAQVRIVQTKKGTEFLNKTLHAYFASEGIHHQTSVARTPEQNGVVERRNRTPVEAARTMLSPAKVPLFFWAEAITTACFTQNRSLVIPRHEKTPYHVINDRKPLVKFFYIFGSLCYIVRDGENLDKLKEKGNACIFVGYSTQSRAYKVFNKRTRVIVETIHVNFDELPQMASDHISSDLVPQYGEMCMFALTVSQTEPKNIKEVMADSAWIESVQEELHQFDRLDEGIDFEESFAPVVGLEAVRVGTPMATKHLDADLSGTSLDQTKYHSMVKALMYLTASRPDIVHATCYCARYQAKLTEKHLTAVKRIFRYLKDTIHMGLWYPKDTSFQVTAFSDSDHAGCLDSHKSASGGIQFLVLWMGTQLIDYGFHFDKIPMYCDSKAAIAISCNPVQHSRTKYIDVRYHFIKEKVEKGIVKLFFVRTEYQLADLFTKALPEERFKYLVRRLGMRCLTLEELEVLAKESA